MKKIFNKLVRDRIPEIIKKDGHKCKFHIADENEFELKLHEKLQEEINEFFENPCAEEIADIVEVLDTIRKHHKIDYNEIKHQKKIKFIKRGGFNKNLILEWTKENN